MFLPDYNRPVGNNGFQPAPILFTPGGLNAFLAGMFKGSAAFLLCGGPSLANANLGRLAQPGILTCAVNNAATIFRPNLWVSYDSPRFFADSIFRDPAILKFVPVPHLSKPIRVRDEQGALVDSDNCAGQFPSVFGYRHNTRFCPEDWLHEDSVNTGQCGDEADPLGIAGVRSVLLAAIKLLYYLGARHVFLLGCDFHMSYGQRNYGFEQTCSRRTVRSNNRLYRVISARLEALKPYFDEAGFKICNCTENSGLKVFPFMDLDDALSLATESMPTCINTEGMYDRSADNG